MDCLCVGWGCGMMWVGMLFGIFFGFGDLGLIICCVWVLLEWCDVIWIYLVCSLCKESYVLDIVLCVGLFLFEWY